MFKTSQLYRLFKINIVLMRYNIISNFVGKKFTWMQPLTYLNPWSWQTSKYNRAESLRMAFESLGPIFVKFGQALSTRGDLLPDDVAMELQKLQDQVPSFSGKIARQMVEESFKQPIDKLFKKFDEKALASASIAQVHAATLNNGDDVIVKVLRPDVHKLVKQDVALMYTAAKMTEKIWSQGRRLHLTDIVREFEKNLENELDLQYEAANASQLRRNFEDSTLLYVPSIYWDYVSENVMVQERIYGVPIGDIKALRKAKVNMKKLSIYGVEIFFTQVFRDSFFHADMHPGNIFVDITDPENPGYLGVDFGIMGTLNPDDQKYIAENLWAFFNRDYKRVAELHIESGWVAPNTRIDEFESAIRTVCEPIFEKPLKDISFGLLLLRLFRTAEKFNMEVQPQLVLLQKTLLNIEGLGRDLYPELDLWETGKPFLEKFIRKQKGVKSFSKDFAVNIPAAIETLVKIPPVLNSVLLNIQRDQRLENNQRLKALGDLNASKHKKRGFIQGIASGLLIAGVVLLWTARRAVDLHPHATHSNHPWAWVMALLGGGMLLWTWVFGSARK